MRLAQDGNTPGGSTYDHARAYRSMNPHGPGPLHSRGLRTAPSASAVSAARRRGLEKRTASPKKLRKPGSLQSAYLIAQADSQCFHALPAKLQQKLFSPEERRRFRLTYRESVILDAADEAFYRRDHLRHQFSSDSLRSGPALSIDHPTTTSVFWDSDSDSDLDLDDEEHEHDSKMDQSIYDSFRWLDADGDLDLSLDEYHAHIADAATNKPFPRRRPSFRRSLSFSTHVAKHRQTASVPPRSIPPSHSLPPLAPVVNHNSSSRPPSRHQSNSQHGSKSSTSSIDPSAQYYQDPDARLKLRVYLASPQKFDEAIEFGFPALDQDKENVAPDVNSLSPVSPVSISREYAGTFFEEDDGTMVGTPGGSVVEVPAPSMASQMRETPRPSIDTPSLLQRRQSFLPGSRSGPQRLPGNREMTLKMTLTRPDLRTESPTSIPSPNEDPLRLAALPPADRSQHIWDDLDDEQGMVKKMWRRLRRRN
ncbi:hypothetical protein N7478_012111 [Penicillium angulare]|uniref:uncharacterized protein n=1 Tax=Penicillium angulare TaxID=116970 RepID=UPI002542303D|nr:uncharacterized protein N7478_012111 [Penicillium angulare]KAJ5260506.1 hypothetical protein N7478_012111 [Penicillium angulare]